MKNYKPFDPNTTPQNRLLIVYFPSGEYDLGEFQKRDNRVMWVTEYGDWHFTAKDNLFWCEVPLVEMNQPPDEQVTLDDLGVA